MDQQAMPIKNRIRNQRKRGGALIGALGVSLVLTLLLTGTITLASNYRNMSKVRSDSEAALLLAEAGVNEELNRISLRMPNYAAAEWASSPDQLTGEPYRGRKAQVPDVPGDYWVYASTGEDSTTAWPGSGPIYVTATAMVGKSMRKVSVEANVVTTTASDGYGQFNVFVLENAETAGGHSEGPVAVGANWKGNYEAGQHNFSATVGNDQKIGIYNHGNCEEPGRTKKTFNGNHVHVKGNVTCTLQMNGGGTRKTNVSKTWFETEWAKAVAASEAIRAASKLTIDASASNVSIDVRTNTLNGSKRIYSLDGNRLNSLKTFNINGMGANDTVIIDVTGSNIYWKWQVNCSYKDRLIWNFRDASGNVEVKDRSMTGSLLAPHANLFQYNNIQGSVIVNDWFNYGAPEVHYTGFKFAGDAFGAFSGGAQTPGSVTYKGNYKQK